MKQNKTLLNPLNEWMNERKKTNNIKYDDTIPNLSKFAFDKEKKPNELTKTK